MTYVLVNASGLLVVVLLLLGHMARAGSRFSYLYVFSATWFVLLVGSQMALRGTIRPGVATLIVLYLAWWVFLATALVLASPIRDRWRQECIMVRRVPGLLVLAVLLVGNLVVTYLQTRSYLLGAPGLGLLQLSTTASQARVAGLTQQYDPPWYGQLFLGAYIYYLPLAGILLRQGYIRRRAFSIVVALAVAVGLSQYTRAPLVQIAGSLFVTGLIVFRLEGRRIATWSLLGATGMLVLFVSMQLVLQGNYRQGYVAADASDSVQLYAFGSAKAYETVLLGQYPAGTDTLYSLEAAEYLLNKLGLVSSYADPVRDYAVIGPYATNTYTFLDAYTLDFGIAGMLLGVGFLGVVCVSVERWALSKGSFQAIVAYSYVITAMAMSIWNYELGRFGFPLAIGMAFLIGVVTRPRSAAPAKSGPDPGETKRG